MQHPDFHGRTSLKYVLPALVDDLSYEGLAVPNGEVATLRWAEAVYCDAPARPRGYLRRPARLLRDRTLAMVRLYQELLAGDDGRRGA